MSSTLHLGKHSCNMGSWDMGQALCTLMTWEAGPTVEYSAPGQAS